jgi:hypothetical protein
MSLFSRVREAFSAGEPPDQQFVDPVLGSLRWGDENECWLGEHRGVQFSLDYDRTVRPHPELVDYARSILCDPSFLTESLENARAKAMTEFEAFYHPEIEALTLDGVHFCRRRDGCGLLADLQGGRNFRAWRIEYSGRRCDGIGFDD